MKIYKVLVSMEGPSLNWFHKLRQQHLSWERFKLELLLHYGKANASNSCEIAIGHVDGFVPKTALVPKISNSIALLFP